MKSILLTLSSLFFLFGGCLTAQKMESETPLPVLTGIEILKSMNYAPLEGMKVGVVTNPTGVDLQMQSVADLLHQAENVEVVALFGPEHGIRGDFSAGDKVEDATDPATGLPVYSLYGKNRKPTPQMLEGIDVLVYDIQDIGSRSYTYISTLGLVMQAAAEAGIKVLVLDRPNPLGGNRFEGNLTEEGFYSFVSQFEIPYVHGFTVGELAEFLNGEGLVPGGEACELEVIKMQGWNRDMLWGDTGLSWVPSSPHIPDYETAFYYATTGIMGELKAYSEGVGYPLPFKLMGAPWVDSEAFAKRMNALNLKGVVFRPVHFKPYYGRLKGSELNGVQIHITDFEAVELMPIQFYAMQELHKMYPDRDVFEMGKENGRISMFDKVCGTDRIRKAFSQRFMVEDILPILQEDMQAFMKVARTYFLY